jgi:hypothetical protein
MPDAVLEAAIQRALKELRTGVPRETSAATSHGLGYSDGVRDALEAVSSFADYLKQQFSREAVDGETQAKGELLVSIASRMAEFVKAKTKREP